jgi:hypothetical protein
MTAALPQAERTRVVMLGGSTYPRNPAFDNPRFRRSAEALRAYFLDPAAFNLSERNLLWLFDSKDGPNEQNDQIEAFLRGAMQGPEEQRPLDVIIVFIGHGFFDDSRRYYLAVPSFKPGAAEYSYAFRLLQRTVKEQMRFARKFYLLDACYSASAARELMSAEPVAQRVLSELEAGASEDLPERGTAALCAASKDEEALAPEAEDYTMFSGALLSALEDSSFVADALSLHQLHGLIDALIRKRFGETAVHPEIHVPEQKQGDIAAIPLFPLRRFEPPQAKGVLDAFDADAFADEAVLHTVVVCHSTPDREGLPPLLQVVSDAWQNFHLPIIAAADACRAVWRAPPVPAGRQDGGFLLAHLDVGSAFESESKLRSAVIALCRAEVAVFDLTNWDEGATFLLGVRGVVRRGVTISSVGGKFTIGGELQVPFNLQLLNLAAHSEAQEKEGVGRRPFELIGDKMVNGFRDLAHLPHYLDLPAYDSVRQLGVESVAYRPVQARERVLVLCPFNPDYTRNNFSRLEKVLPSRVQDYVAKVEARPADKPALLRLLDLKTPRLVAQTLFESIRLTDMCVVDWTGMRTNVIFEAGVRMATNPLGAVHVIEHGARQRLRSGARAGPQVLSLLRLFEPVSYRLGGTDTGPFDAMVQRFDASLGAYGRGETNFIYAAAGAALDRHSQPAALSLVNELIRSANILDTEEQESTGISPVLYHEINRELAAEARAAAADRRLAAWLFLARRYDATAIALDALLLDQFELLSSQVRRWARRAKRTDLLEEINGRVRAVRDAAPQEGGALVARAKRDKEEAKDLRDDGDIASAVKVLEDTVKVLSASPLAAGLEAAVSPSKPMRDLASQLADCLGMLGGNYRRQGRLRDAQAAFEAGRVYEESASLEVMSSYNLINAITLPIESDGQALNSQRPNLQKAIDAISRQVRGERRNDRWAWADLAQCQLLYGDEAGALQSYGRVRDLGDDDTVASVTSVLERLGNAVPELKSRAVAAITLLRS